MTTISTYDQHTLRKLQKHGDLILRADGYFGTQQSYWSISIEKMNRLVRLGLARIDCVGESTFARLA